MAHQPVPAVGAICFDADARVLLVRRGREPGRGLWTVPGGRIETGETAAAACAREVAEETGLEVEVLRLAEVVERIAPTHHFVILDFLARVTGGALAAGDDADEVGWFTLAETARLPTTTGLVPVHERALATARAAGYLKA